MHLLLVIAACCFSMIKGHEGKQARLSDIKDSEDLIDVTKKEENTPNEGNTDFPKWNHLSVTFPKFNALPMSEENAKEQGWTLLADNCADKSGPFRGRRFILKGDYANILIFDAQRHIAGMQMAYKTELKKGKYGAYADARQNVQGYYYLTAYFMEPKKVCDADLERAKDIIGDKLVFLTGVNKYMEAPLLSKDTVGTKWILGKCRNYMGTHYWYDINKDMNCDDFFTAFLLYNKDGQLNAWGFINDGYVKSERVEHPPSRYIDLFFKKETMPRCLKELDARSTQHVYFTKVGRSTHIC